MRRLTVTLTPTSGPHYAFRAGAETRAARPSSFAPDGRQQVRHRDLRERGGGGEKPITEFALVSVRRIPPAAGAHRLRPAHEAEVRLSVMDVQGREVAVLAEGSRRRGAIQVTWDGGSGAWPGRRGSLLPALSGAGREASSSGGFFLPLDPEREGGFLSVRPLGLAARGRTGAPRRSAEDPPPARGPRPGRRGRAGSVVDSRRASSAPEVAGRSFILAGDVRSRLASVPRRSRGEPGEAPAPPGGDSPRRIESSGSIPSSNPRRSNARQPRHPAAPVDDAPDGRASLGVVVLDRRQDQAPLRAVGVAEAVTALQVLQP